MWSSKRQDIVTLSTVEAEYVALTRAAQDALWIQQILESLGIDARPVELHCDNTGAISLSQQNASISRTKHMNVRWHFIRQCVAEGSINVSFVRSEDQLADFLTKALSVEVLERARIRIGLHIIRDRNMG